MWHPASPATQYVVWGIGGGNEMSARRRRERIEPTHEWQELLPLFWWPEQEEYERIRQRTCFSALPWPNAPRRPASPSARSGAAWNASSARGWTASSLRRRPKGGGSRQASDGSSWTSRQSTRPSTSTKSPTWFAQPL